MTTLRRKLVSISSANRSGGTSSNFNVSFTDSKIFSDTHKIRLHKLSLPNSFHNIEEESSFAYDIAGGTMRIFTLPAGQYDVSEIEALFTAYVATYGGTETLALDTTTNRFIMTSGTGNINIWSSVGSDLAYILGFDNLAYGSMTATAQRFPNLQGTTTVYLHFSFLGNNCLSPTSNSLGSDVFTMVQMRDCPFGETLHYVGNEHDSVEFSNGVNTSDFQVYLTDVDGNQLDLNGLEWEMLLSYHYHA